MEKREIWGVPYARAEAFFLSQGDVRSCGEGRFRFGDCEIRLAALPPRESGSFSFPRTELCFAGPEPDTQTIYRRFFLRFISAGA